MRTKQLLEDALRHLHVARLRARRDERRRRLHVGLDADLGEPRELGDGVLEPLLRAERLDALCHLGAHLARALLVHRRRRGRGRGVGGGGGAVEVFCAPRGELLLLLLLGLRCAAAAIAAANAAQRRRRRRRRRLAAAAAAACEPAAARELPLHHHANDTLCVRSNTLVLSATRWRPSSGVYNRPGAKEVQCRPGSLSESWNAMCTGCLTARQFAYMRVDDCGVPICTQ